MSAARHRQSTGASGHPRLRDVGWLVWRQHRLLIVTAAVVTLVLCVLQLLVERQLHGLNCPDSDQCAVANGDLFTRAKWLLEAVVATPALVAAFVGAPLVAREIEQGTHIVAWGQDISPRRWLLSKLAVLGAVMAAFAAVLWACARRLAEALTATAPSTVDFSRFSRLPFETLAPLVVSYCVAALALGVAVGAVVRRTLPAVAIAAALFVGSWFAIGQFVRPHYLPAARSLAPVSAAGVDSVEPNPLYLVNNSWADANGHVASYPDGCNQVQDQVAWAACLNSHGVSHRVSIYQPGRREAEFELIEAGLYGLLAAAGTALAVAATRNRVRRRP